MVKSETHFYIDNTSMSHLSVFLLPLSLWNQRIETLLDVYLHCGGFQILRLFGFFKLKLTSIFIC